MAVKAAPARIYGARGLILADTPFSGPAALDSHFRWSCLVSRMSPPSRDLLIRSGKLASIAVRTLSSRGRRATDDLWMRNVARSPHFASKSREEALRRCETNRGNRSVDIGPHRLI